MQSQNVFNFFTPILTHQPLLLKSLFLPTQMLDKPTNPSIQLKIQVFLVCICENPTTLSLMRSFKIAYPFKLKSENNRMAEFYLLKIKSSKMTQFLLLTFFSYFTN